MHAELRRVAVEWARSWYAAQAPATVDWYLLPAGGSAANQPATAAAVNWRNRQTHEQMDALPFHKPCSTYYTGSVDNIAWLEITEILPFLKAFNYTTKMKRKTQSNLLKYPFIHVLYFTHTHPFNGPFSGITRVSWYEKGKTNLDFTEARDSEWQWHQLGHMQVCISLQTDNHASIPLLSFLQAGCLSCRPTYSVKPLKG